MYTNKIYIIILKIDMIVSHARKRKLNDVITKEELKINIKSGTPLMTLLPVWTECKQINTNINITFC